MANKLLVLDKDGNIVHVEEFEKMLMVTDNKVGMMGNIDQKSMIGMLAMLVGDIAETYLDMEESIDTYLMACVIGANVASLSLGFIVDGLDGIEDDVKAELEGIAMEIIGAAKKASDISSVFTANTPNELSKMIGSKLMDELDEYEEGNN